ncbi:MAG: hypothetical protein M3Q56_01670 [Bacteroidota bacterium]|nr:hypothetical protein [Bacteroidota bacterium]
MKIKYAVHPSLAYQQAIIQILKKTRGHSIEIPTELTPSGGLEKKDRITHAFHLYQPKDFTKKVKFFVQISFDLASM